MATIMEAFDPSIVAVAAAESSSSKKTCRTPAIPMFARGDAAEEMGTTSVVPRPLSFHPLQASLCVSVGDGWFAINPSIDHEYHDAKNGKMFLINFFNRTRGPCGCLLTIAQSPGRRTSTASTPSIPWRNSGGSTIISPYHRSFLRDATTASSR